MRQTLLLLTMILAACSLVQGQSMTFPQAQQQALNFYGPTAMTAEVRRGNSSAIERWIGPSTGYGGCDMVLTGKTVGSNWSTTVNGVQPVPPPPTVPAGELTISLSGIRIRWDTALGDALRQKLLMESPGAGWAIELIVANAMRADAENRLKEALYLLRAINPQAFDAIMQAQGVWVE